MFFLLFLEFLFFFFYSTEGTDFPRMIFPSKRIYIYKNLKQWQKFLAEFGEKISANLFFFKILPSVIKTNNLLILNLKKSSSYKTVSCLVQMFRQVLISKHGFRWGAVERPHLDSAGWEERRQVSVPLLPPTSCQEFWPGRCRVVSFSLRVRLSAW